jgi:uncharacterized protein YaaN involved in tellurite resistance
MSDIDDIALEVSSLEKATNRNAVEINQNLIALTIEVAALRETQEKMMEILHLISKPNAENREKVNALMDAYERYEFVRKLSTSGE